jgi:hypothetical protein
VGDDRLGRPLGTAQVDAKRRGAHDAGERLAAVGGDDDLRAQGARGGKKVFGPVGGGGEDQEDARHAPLLYAPWSAFSG